MKFTDNALTQFKQVIEESGNLRSGIRFLTVPGCCSPLLKMEVTDAPKSGDVVVKMGEVDFFLTPDADKLLSTLAIDFSDGSFHSAKI